MSFECRHYLNGWCELRKLECVPGAKGCVLVKAGVYFIGEKPEKEKDKKEPENKD